VLKATTTGSPKEPGTLGAAHIPVEGATICEQNICIIRGVKTMLCIGAQLIFETSKLITNWKLVVSPSAVFSQTHKFGTSTRYTEADLRWAFLLCS